MPLTTGLGLSDDYVHYNDGPMPPSIQLHGCHRDTRVSTNFPLRRWVLDVPIRFEPGNLQAYPHEAMFRRASETSMYVDPSRRGRVRATQRTTAISQAQLSLKEGRRTAIWLTRDFEREEFLGHHLTQLKNHHPIRALFHVSVSSRKRRPLDSRRMQFLHQMPTSAARRYSIR
jgi:hypothetical protein